ncbi:MAG: hypothetical protein CL389_07325 [Acidiferrobacteraceae bacterium]|nr:hypothetical protein [Acidiferrobacteraceae bacterium]MDP6551336.1 peptidylprolyl isomerase [Arenicellales bacterium]MDP6792304.1 peptidylprolyl isomerase [Arenicellales bacterium]
MELVSVFPDLKHFLRSCTAGVKRGFSCTLVAFVAWIALSASAVAEQSLNRVMVVVNDGVITEADLNREVALAEMELRSAGRPVPPRDVLLPGLLEELIVDALLLGVAERFSIVVSNQEVAYALMTIAQQNGLSLAQLRTAIADTGVAFEDYESDLRKQLIIRQLINREIRRQITVSAQEVDEYLAQNPTADAPAPLELELAHILLKVPGDASEAEVAREERSARYIRQRINDGLAFAEAARRYSDGGKAAEGGSLGVRTAEQLPQLFLDAVEGVPVGGLSAIFQSSNGWHLLKVLGRRSQQQMVVLQREVRHILVRASTLLPEEQLRARLERIRDRIVAGEDFAAVARLQSEDTNTRALGGNLGWLNSGELPGEFEQALNPLSINEVSPIFQTAAGWHIAEITAEREKDVGDALRRRQAERIIIGRKTEEAFEQWTQSLREEAFVRYRVRPGE